MLWSGIEGITAWMIGVPEDYVLPAAALVTAAMMGWRMLCANKSVEAKRNG